MSVRRSECAVPDFTPSQHFPVELIVLLIDCIVAVTAVTRGDIQPFVSNNSRTHTPS